MNKLKIALLQISPAGSLAGNAQKGINACKKAHETYFLRSGQKYKKYTL